MATVLGPPMSSVCGRLMLEQLYTISFAMYTSLRESGSGIVSTVLKTTVSYQDEKADGFNNATSLN